MRLTIVASLLASIAGFVVAWQLQAHQIIKLELNHAQERIALQRAARATYERNTTALIQAQNHSTVRDRAVRDNVAVTGSAGNGLRITTASAVRAATESADTCPNSAAALAAVSDQCFAELQGLAEIADRHVNDIKTLIEAWPQ